LRNILLATGLHWQVIARGAQPAINSIRHLVRGLIDSAASHMWHTLCY
jgi:hypothetical protein